MALKPVDIDAHNALAAALAGPDASNDWRGRGSGERGGDMGARAQPRTQ